MIREESYRVSERVLLEPGDVFRAKHGPYWKSASGEKLSLAAKGPFRFVALCKEGPTTWIEAFDKNGQAVALHIAGRRAKIDLSLVPRPYTITGKKRNASKRKDASNKAGGRPHKKVRNKKAESEVVGESIAPVPASRTRRRRKGVST